MRLTAIEAKLALCAKRGEPLNLSAEGGTSSLSRVIRGEAIRSLMLCLPVSLSTDDDEQVISLPPTGVQLIGALIEGDINLADARPSGGCLPTLKLMDCQIGKRVCLCRSNISNVSLQGSRFSIFCANQSTIGGQLDLSSISISDPQQATGYVADECPVQLSGAAITKDVFLNYSTLHIDAENKPSTKSGRVPFSLNMRSSVVGGSIFLNDANVSGGTINLYLAKISGDLDFIGITADVVGGPAVNAMESHVRGAVRFGPRTPPESEMLSTSSISAADNFPSLDFTSAKVDGEFSVRGITLRGDLRATNAHFGDDIIISPAWAGTHLPNIVGDLHFFSITCEKDILIDTCGFENLNISNSHIHGKIEIFGNRSNDKFHKGDASFIEINSINISSSQIDKDVNIGTNIGQYRDLFLNKRLLLSGSIVGGNLSVESASIIELLGCINISVGGQAVFSDLSVNGSMDLFLSKFSSNLRIIDIATVPSDSNKEKIGNGLLWMDQCEVAGNLTILGLNGGNVSTYEFDVSKIEFAPYSLVARQLNVSGNVTISRAHIGGEINLQNSNIRGDLDLSEIEPLNNVAKFNLIGARVSSLNDDGGAAINSKFQIFVEGFDYARLAKRQGARSASTDRKRWLNLQYKTGKPEAQFYIPEAYERVAATFRSEGLYHDAHMIVRERLRLDRTISERNPLLKILLWLFANLFDSGLSPIRAVAIFVFCLVAGTIATTVADDGVSQRFSYGSLFPPGITAHLPQNIDLKPVMVVETNTVNSVAVMDRSAHRVTADMFKSTGAGAVGEIPCGREIEPGLYAIDIFVPVLDLHQRGRCSISTVQSAWPWRWARAVYSVLGWIVSSLTVLTVTGVLRRQVES